MSQTTFLRILQMCLFVCLPLLITSLAGADLIRYLICLSPNSTLTRRVITSEAAFTPQYCNGCRAALYETFSAVSVVDKNQSEDVVHTWPKGFPFLMRGNFTAVRYISYGVGMNFSKKMYLEAKPQLRERENKYHSQYPTVRPIWGGKTWLVRP